VADSTVGGSWSPWNLIGISSANAADDSRKLGLVGRLIRNQVDSSFEKELFERYWLAEGDLQLPQAEFDQIAAGLGGLPILESYQIGTANGLYFAHKFDFYSNPRYDAGLGSAWVIFDSSGRAVGLYDRYDFNPKPWGVRSVSAEMKTRGVNFSGRLAGAAPYQITYGTYFELP
jgi:hypothetical protein